MRRGGDAVSPSGVSFVASFLGRTNLLDAVFLGCKDQALELDVEGQLVSIKAATAGEPCHAVRVMMRPEAIGIGFPGDSLTATVVSSTYLGDRWSVWYASHPRPCRFCGSTRRRMSAFCQDHGYQSVCRQRAYSFCCRIDTASWESSGTTSGAQCPGITTGPGDPVATEPKVRFRLENGPSSEVRWAASDKARGRKPRGGSRCRRGWPMGIWSSRVV